MSQTLNDRYRIDGKVGEGGMAVVYRGLDTVLNRVVAIKVLREQYAQNEQFLRRFQREAQNVSNLKHPNIATVYDARSDGDMWYIVMELIEGTDLASVIKRTAPFTAVAATDVMAQVMSALDYAHDSGIVHRDVKPHNILIDSRGTAKVVDFGIAKGVNDITMTDAGTALGTAGYISPEQATGAPITAASDLYSAGVVLYEMLTGRLPFTGDSAVQVAMQHVRNAPPPPTRFNPKIARPVELVVQQAMEKNPEHRYASGAALVAALRAAIARGDAPPAPTAAVPLRGGGRGATATAVLPPTTHALAIEAAPAVRPAVPVNGRRRPVAPVAAPAVPRQASSGPGIGVWFLGFVLFCSVIALAYFGYQILNAAGDTGATQTVTARVAAATSTSATQTAASRTTATRPATTTTTTAVVAVVATATPTNLLEVSNFSGLPQDDAQERIRSLGFMVGRERRSFNDTNAGKVIAQEPSAGSRVSRGTAINLDISLGPETTDLGKLEKDGGAFDPRNKTYAEVEEMLRNRGLKPTAVNEPGDLEVGRVLRLDPNGAVRNGSEVKVFVSTGMPAPTATVVPPTAIPATAVPMPVATPVPMPTATRAPMPTARVVPTATAMPPTATLAPTPTPVPPPPTPNPIPATRPIPNTGPTAVLPGVIGQRPEDAQRILNNAGFTNVQVANVQPGLGAPAVPRGTVYQVVGGQNFTMSLAPGEAHPRGGLIVLLYQA